MIKTRSCRTIGQDNLPQVTLRLKWQTTNIDISGRGYDAPIKIGEGTQTAPISLGGGGVPIETLSLMGSFDCLPSGIVAH